ncbi:uncharacterized protein LOC106173212 [Lingula anatina]|uniref:Uncharacterized protein LOC106173212 n=1 Tax=Lingula anatina TaxID=7574 RepID=A0A1S3JH81_LINAN|nr:uncharacterized protein LOC106173212 [Lingula anatina]|eukprot:XP_013409718.1 uncharacterized protein LOC106173212 [Lingula anatina]
MDDQIDDQDGLITFEDLGKKKREATAETVLGKTRTWQDLEKKEIAFFIIAVISLLALLGFAIYSAVTQTGHDFTFALLIIVNIGFCFLYVVGAVLGERPYETFIFVIANVIIIVYVCSNFAITYPDIANGKDDVRFTVKLVRLIFTVILVPLNIYLGLWVWYTYFQSGNLILRTVGASEALQNSCKTLFFTEAALDVDVQMASSMLLLILKDGHTTGTLWICVLTIGFAFTVAWSVLGYFAMRYENKILTFIFFATSVFEPGYIIFKVYQAATDVADENQEPDTSIDAVTFVGAGLALIVRVILLVFCYKVYSNYGVGLKEKVFIKPFWRSPYPPLNPRESTKTYHCLKLATESSPETQGAY